MERVLKVEETRDLMPHQMDESDRTEFEVPKDEQNPQLPEEVDQDEEEVDLESEQIEKSTDPVALYLHDIGSIPLLTRELEVQLGKQMEEGQEEFIETVFSFSIASRTVLDLATNIKRNELRLCDVLMGAEWGEERVDESEEQKQFQSGVLKLQRLSREYGRILGIEEEASLKNKKSSTRKKPLEEKSSNHPDS